MCVCVCGGVFTKTHWSLSLPLCNNRSLSSPSYSQRVKRVKLIGIQTSKFKVQTNVAPSVCVTVVVDVVCESGE